MMKASERVAGGSREQVHTHTAQRSIVVHARITHTFSPLAAMGAVASSLRPFFVRRQMPEGENERERARAERLNFPWCEREGEVDRKRLGERR